MPIIYVRDIEWPYVDFVSNGSLLGISLALHSCELHPVPQAPLICHIYPPGH